MNIPPVFWKSLSDKEFKKLCETSVLNKKLCARLWAMQGLQNPPDSMLVVVNAEELMRVFPAKGQMS